MRERDIKRRSNASPKAYTLARTHTRPRRNLPRHADTNTHENALLARVGRRTVRTGVSRIVLPLGRRLSARSRRRRTRLRRTV
jgi:hypothetical protein